MINVIENRKDGMVFTNKLLYMLNHTSTCKNNYQLTANKGVITISLNSNKN